jgi:hypothetical protein
MGTNLQYFRDAEVAKLFEEEVDRDFPSHDDTPEGAASFLTPDSCSDSEEEEFCYSYCSGSSRD